MENQLSDIDQQIESVDQHTQNLERAARQRRQKQREAKRRAERRKNKQQEQAKREKNRRLRRQQNQRIKAKNAKDTKSRNKRQRSSLKKSRSRRSSSNKLTQKQKRFLLSLKPKTSNLSIDDFKCIFCFELPDPLDSHGGIVLCPKCNYPSHYDEFKQWVKSSTLCSRCDSELPLHFRRNPKVIPTKTYFKAFRFWKKRFKN